MRGASVSKGSESAMEGGIEGDWEEFSTKSVSASRLTVLFPPALWDQPLQLKDWCRLENGDLSGHSCGNLVAAFCLSSGERSTFQ